MPAPATTTHNPSSLSCNTDSSDAFKAWGKRLQAVVPLLCLFLPAWTHAQATFSCPGEQEQARATMRHIEREWPLRNSQDPVSTYVQGLGDRLAGRSPEARPVSWRFAVLRDYSVNAFAIGGGYVYVTEGALRLSRNESELASILAHEMGHQLAGHFCQPQPGFWDSLPGLFRWGHDDGDRVNHIRIGSLTQVLDPAKETEADNLAIRLLLAAGYDPHAMLDLARRLPLNTYHLRDPGRIQNLERLLAGVPRRFTDDSERFRQIKRLLTEQ